MADHDRGNRALQMVFSLLIGFVVVALAGVGMRAAYPSPDKLDSELRQLNEQQTALDAARVAAGSLSGKHEAIYRKVNAEIGAKKKAVQAGREGWIRTTGIGLMALSVLIIAVSLLFKQQLRLISDGLSFGGVFIAWYAAALTLAKSASGSRYVFAVIALVLTLAVGYMKLVRTPRDV